MRLILSSCDFGNPVSAREICDNLGKPIADCRVLYFPNERYTEEKIKNGVYTSVLRDSDFHAQISMWLSTATPSRI